MWQFWRSKSIDKAVSPKYGVNLKVSLEKAYW